MKNGINSLTREKRDFYSSAYLSHPVSTFPVFPCWPWYYLNNMASGNTAIFQGDDTLNFGDIGEGKGSLIYLFKNLFSLYSPKLISEAKHQCMNPDPSGSS